MQHLSYMQSRIMYIMGNWKAHNPLISLHSFIIAILFSYA